MKLKSRYLILALAAVAVVVLGVFFALKPAATSAQTNSQLPAAPQPRVAATVVPNGPRVVMDTTMGRITCQFFQKQAPVAVANFIGLAKGTKEWTNPVTKQKEIGKSLYDGTIFHRVIPGFMIQGGDPTGTGRGGPGYKFDDEFDTNLNFDRAGRLAMANRGPNTNGSQFFITVAPYPTGNQQYTIFGQCTEPSIEVANAIADVPTNADNRPLTPVVLKKVTIVPVGQPLPPVPAWEQTAPQPPPAPVPQQP